MKINENQTLKPKNHIENQWKSMKINENQTLKPKNHMKQAMKTNKKSVKINENQTLKPKNHIENQWKSMKIIENQWKSSPKTEKPNQPWQLQESTTKHLLRPDPKSQKHQIRKTRQIYVSQQPTLVDRWEKFIEGRSWVIFGELSLSFEKKIRQSMFPLLIYVSLPQMLKIRKKQKTKP